MLTELKIKLAQANNAIESLRRAEIEERIATRYTKSQEFRLYIDREANPDTWQEHEAFVNQIKEQVDSEIAKVIN